MKMMSIAAVAYPRYDSIQNADFNGEIGIWPVVATNPARHFSINRPKCTYVTTLLTVDKIIFKNFLIEKVSPATRDSFLSGSGRLIYVQEVNAQPNSC